MYYLIVPKEKRFITETMKAPLDAVIGKTPNIHFIFDVKRHADVAIWNFTKQKAKEWVAVLDLALGMTKGQLYVSQIMLDVERDFPEYIEITDIFQELLLGIFEEMGEFKLYDIYGTRSYVVKNAEDVEKVSSVLADTRKECFVADIELHKGLQNLSDIKVGLKRIKTMPEQYRVFSIKGYLNQLKNANQLDQERADILVTEAMEWISDIKDPALQSYLFFRFTLWLKVLADSWFYSISVKTMLLQVIPLVEQMPQKLDTTQHILVNLYIFARNSASTDIVIELRNVVLRLIQNIHKSFFWFPEFQLLKVMSKTGNKEESVDAYFAAADRYPLRKALRKRYQKMYYADNLISSFRSDTLRQSYLPNISATKRTKYIKQMMKEANRVQAPLEKFGPILIPIILAITNIISLLALIQFRAHTSGLIALKHPSTFSVLFDFLFIGLFPFMMAIFVTWIFFSNSYYVTKRIHDIELKRKKTRSLLAAGIVVIPVTIFFAVFPMFVFTSNNVIAGFTTDSLFSGISNYAFDDYSNFTFTTGSSYCSSTSYACNDYFKLILDTPSSSAAAVIEFKGQLSSDVSTYGCGIVVPLQKHLESLHKNITTTQEYKDLLDTACFGKKSTSTGLVFPTFSVNSGQVYASQLTNKGKSYKVSFTPPLYPAYTTNTQNNKMTISLNKKPILTVGIYSGSHSAIQFIGFADLSSKSIPGLYQVFFEGVKSALEYHYVNNPTLSKLCKHNSKYSQHCGQPFADIQGVPLDIVCPDFTKSFYCLELVESMDVTKVN